MSEIDHTPPGQADAVRKEQDCELRETDLNRVSGGGKVGGFIIKDFSFGVENPTTIG